MTCSLEFTAPNKATGINEYVGIVLKAARKGRSSAKTVRRFDSSPVFDDAGFQPAKTVTGDVELMMAKAATAFRGFVRASQTGSIAANAADQFVTLVCERV